MPIRKIGDKEPVFQGEVYLADSSYLIGSVILESGVSVWYGSVIRADLNSIEIGKSSNIQENVLIHPTEEKGVKIGKLVTIGHGAIVHACTVGNRVLIGINAVILDGAVIGDDSIIAAQSIVLSGTTIPSGSLVAGVPGKVIRSLTEEEIKNLTEHALKYELLAKSQLDRVGGE